MTFCAEPDRPLNVGLIGTGFVARHIALELGHRTNWRLGKVLTRRHPAHCAFPAPEALTTSIDDLIDGSDVVIECTGDVLWATVTIDKVLAAGKPVLTLDPEFHVATGSYFVGKGLLSEADGDQPGCIASLHEQAVTMGFEPLVLGNMKGFLNRSPAIDDMRFWGQKQGISLQMVTSFTDGTKVQVEQALVGNHFGADIACEDMMGPATDDLNEAARLLGDTAVAMGRPITDYVLSRKLPHGVFVVARHKPEQVDALRYLKMGEGPYYTLVYPNIMVHLEVFKTLERIRRGGGVLLDNSATPRISVAAVAKRELEPGLKIETGAGSFEMRGICVRIAERVGHLPIGLAQDVVLKRRVEPGQIVTMDDVELPDSLALKAWRTVEGRVLAAGQTVSAAA